MDLYDFFGLIAYWLDWDSFSYDCFGYDLFLKVVSFYLSVLLTLCSELDFNCSLGMVKSCFLTKDVILVMV